MKKFVALFTDSYRELKSVRTITTMAMLAAIAIILGMFSNTAILSASVFQVSQTESLPTCLDRRLAAFFPERLILLNTS